MTHEADRSSCHPELDCRLAQGFASVPVARFEVAHVGEPMTANERFFRENRKPQTILKHAVLRRYLSTFAGATGTNSPEHRVGYVDGYAGPGEYLRPSGVLTEGSPKIALKIAADQVKAGRFLGCVFVERDPEYVAALEELVSKATTYSRVIAGDVKKNLPEALKAFANLPMLVFLDPYGAALGTTETIDLILNRGGDQPTELLLNFSMQAVRRMGSRLHEPEGASGREATLATMDEWLGGDWWRRHFEPGRSPDDAAHLVAREYAERVRKATGCNVFGIPIRKQAGDKPLFFLFLFYPRQLAGWKYNEAVSLGQEEWRSVLWGLDIEEAAEEDELDPRLGVSRADELRDAFKASEAQFADDAVDSIKHSIATLLETRDKLYVQRDFAAILGTSVGEGREKHLRRAWKELAAEGTTIAPPTGKLEKATITRAPGRLPAFEAEEVRIV